jgi:hypothetical protein
LSVEGDKKMIRLRVDFGGRLSSRGWDLVPLQGRPLSCALQVSVPIFYEAQAKSKIRKERTATAAASKRQQPQTGRPEIALSMTVKAFQPSPGPQPRSAMSEKASQAYAKGLDHPSPAMVAG